MNKLIQLEEELNRNICPFCGKLHTVSLYIAGGNNPITIHSFSEDACDMFREHVKARVSIISNMAF